MKSVKSVKSGFADWVPDPVRISKGNDQDRQGGVFMICQNCNSEIPEGAKFCVNCGAPAPVADFAGTAEAVQETAAEAAPETHETAEEVVDFVLNPVNGTGSYADPAANAGGEAAPAGNMTQEFIDRSRQNQTSGSYTAPAGNGGSVNMTQEYINHSQQNRANTAYNNGPVYNANNGPVNNGPYVNNNVNGGTEPGRGAAIAALILGIASIVFWFLGGLLSIPCGIAGIVLANSAKKAGNQSGMRTAGFIMSLVGLILGALIFVGCVACVGILGSID